MAVVQETMENQRKISLPRRLATYIASMNIAKVFRRHHTKETPSKTFDKSPFIHHQHTARPFSYHIPATEQIPSTTLLKPSNVIPYRIGISSDRTLLNNTAQTNDNDEIVRLPMQKANRTGLSPKMRKDRRFQSQLNANKRWLFRSMETLDGWKGKVFPQKQRTSDSSQTRSHSVDNLAESNADENRSIQKQQQQRALSPNRSIEAITNRMINSIGIHRKSTNPIPNPTRRSPALTIEKHRTNGKLNRTKNSSSAILDFREISSFGFTQSRRSSTDNENNSLTPSDNINTDIHLSDDEITSNLSYLGNGHDQQTNNNNNELSDSWDFSITWIDSLKEQHSPQRKIQFYENLIKLLEQDTLNIDELLVLRKVLARIWPTDESTTTNFDSNIQLPSFELNPNGTRSLRASNTTKRRSTLTHHTAQRCSTVIERSPFVYEALNEQYSGHKTKPTTDLAPVKAKPCLIENRVEQHYPQDLNPFDEKVDVKPSAPPCEQVVTSQNDDSIRRYFERLTLLETIYEKLNIESNKPPIETKEPTIPSNKNISNRFIEMNVDGNGSTSSEKSSTKRRAPKAPHISQTNPPMFTLSSADVNIPQKIDQEINIPIQIVSSTEKNAKEKPIPDVTASCDIDGQIFVYDSNTIPHQNIDEPSGITVHVNIQSQQPFSLEMLPRKTEQIQQWLSTCDTKDECNNQLQYKMRCTAKSIRPRSPSPLTTQNDTEPGRFRSCLKINLENAEASKQRSRASSATTKYFDRHQTSYDDMHSSDDDYYHTDRQSVYL